MPVRLRNHGTAQRIGVAAIGALILFRIAWQLGTHSDPPSVEPPMEGEYQLLEIREKGQLLVRPLHAPPGSPSLTVSMLAVATPSGLDGNSRLQQFLRTQLDTATVRLRFDRRRNGVDGTTLAWVFRGDRLINVEIVRDGLLPAETHSSDSASLRRQVIQAEKEAKQARRGIWMANRSVNSQTDP
ncbi:MAG: thermonuclease family protein [Planctomycetes bacterium]|nr:thermonuclease family protein [Planctomycetota bacterium]